MKEKKSPEDLILAILAEKSSLKQDVYSNTLETFKIFKEVAREVAIDLNKKIIEIDPRLIIEFRDKGEFELELMVAGDLLIFSMHTNVFDFDKSHNIWKTSYVSEDPLRSYCGMINIYNFLADSFQFSRSNDIGYLIARIFINKELHYFVEGKRQLGFLYNDFVHSVIDKAGVKAIIESSILYSLDFDLLTPPYDSVKEVSVYEMVERSNIMQIKTGKRLGFKFQVDDDSIS